MFCACIVEMSGRPQVECDREMIAEYIAQGYKKSKIACLLNISRGTLDKIIQDDPALQNSSSYTQISDMEIDELMISAKEQLPLAGERMIIGFFTAKG